MPLSKRTGDRRGGQINRWGKKKNHKTKRVPGGGGAMPPLPNAKNRMSKRERGYTLGTPKVRKKRKRKRGRKKRVGKKVYPLGDRPLRWVRNLGD